MLTILDKDRFDAFFSILEQSFPLDEYRTREEQRALFDLAEYTALAAVDENGRINGVFGVWDLEDVRFVEHFAVSPTLRGGGLGTHMFHELLKTSPAPVVLEVEPPNDPVAVRRIGFYERCGMVLNRYFYMQPAITAGRHAIPLYLMTQNAPVDETEFFRLRDLLYRRVYRLDVSDPLFCKKTAVKKP